ncbi:ABC transporter ATP-binding protein [Stieleria varia]|uniref:Putative ABC transporter ATP-binding protein YxlF n=1 Tax=Stieleria varia TaxID=2528005 RepID=A0A5C6AYR6_9BACT|nr:ABC transporter ATP-binding protein [Stieleria varia]TWU04272.1 putative ABC transporter ATP-binding protein YxlF [Stieleria varia]
MPAAVAEELSESSIPVARPVVQVDRLSKRYGEFYALRECTLAVQPGDVFGLLGPNGAGKTTLIRSLLGHLRPTSGSATVDGCDPQVDAVALRRKVSYLPGDARLPRHLRGDAVLSFFAELHPEGDLRRSREVAERLELDLRVRVAMMSTGMRQKLALAVVLGPMTPLLILDEPTANLDPTVRAAVLDLVMEAHAAGRTVMFSSHVLSEIEDTCNRVVFLRRGLLVRELQMRDLFQRHRISAALSSGRTVQSIEIPEAFADCVTVTSLRDSKDSDSKDSDSKGSESEGSESRVRIDTSGDLSPMLRWISELGLKEIRIEPLGLRAVYNDVHRGTDAQSEMPTR